MVPPFPKTSDGFRRDARWPNMKEESSPVNFMVCFFLTCSSWVEYGVLIRAASHAKLGKVIHDDIPSCEQLLEVCRNFPVFHIKSYFASNGA